MQDRPLEKWLSESGRKRVDFARAIGCSPPHLTLVAQGKRGVSLGLALSIERETQQAVTVEQMLRNKNAEAAIG